MQIHRSGAVVEKELNWESEHGGKSERRQTGFDCSFRSRSSKPEPGRRATKDARGL